MRPMMKCGHQANAYYEEDGEKKPSCVICVGISPGAKDIDDRPWEELLKGRFASCYCGRTEPSIKGLEGSLAFFEYLGGVSRSCGICGYSDVTHENLHEINPVTNRKNNSDHDFIPRVWEQDRYYCGCNGWD